MRRVGLVAAAARARDKAEKAPFQPAAGVGPDLVRRAGARGLILRSLAGDCIAFSPPLVISAAEIEEMLTAFGRALDDTLAWTRETGIIRR